MTKNQVVHNSHSTILETTSSIVITVHTLGAHLVKDF